MAVLDIVSTFSSLQIMSERGGYNTDQRRGGGSGSSRGGYGSRPDRGGGGGYSIVEVVAPGITKFTCIDNLIN